MTENDYSRREIVAKLGITPGATVFIADAAWPVAAELRQQIADRTGGLASPDEAPVDVVLATVDPATDSVALLRYWRARLKASGSIWLLTRKRGHPGYVDQRLLIAHGAAAALVDNKVCSISDTVSAIRFVIRRADRW